MTKDCPICGVDCAHYRAGEPPLTKREVLRLLELLERLRPPWYQRAYERVVEWLRVRFWR